MKQHPPTHFALLAAALAIVVLVIVLVGRKAGPTAMQQADDRAGTEGLSRAMTFSPRAEPKP